MIIGTSMGQEICLIFGQVSLNLLYGKKNLQTDICGPGYKKAVNIQARSLRPELWIKMGRNAKLKERQKWSHEMPKLDNARQLRGIYFIDSEDKEFKGCKKKIGNTNGSSYALQDQMDESNPLEEIPLGSPPFGPHPSNPHPSNPHFLGPWGPFSTHPQQLNTHKKN